MPAPIGDELSAQLDQRFASHVLWHFTGRLNFRENENYNRLVSILGSSLRVGPKPPAFTYFVPSLTETKTQLGYPVNCLADIPFKDLIVHAKRYGRCAIGFHRNAAIQHGFTPMLYTNQYSPDFQRFMQTRDAIEDLVAQLKDTELSSKIDELLYYLGSIAKAGLLDMAPRSDDQFDAEDPKNNYYYEREWRSIREWNFSAEAVAAVMLPGHMLEKFAEDRKARNLKVTAQTAIIPFDMIWRF